MTKPSLIKKVTWVKDASIQYVGTDKGVYARTGDHEYDDVLHVFVEYEDGSTLEWSSDWGDKRPPEWASDAIDWATTT